MPGLKRLSAKEVISVLEDFEFSVISQRGSHIKLGRVYKEEKQTLIVPNHKELDTGTLKAIYRQFSKYVSAEKLRPYFYSD